MRTQLFSLVTFLGLALLANAAPPEKWADPHLKTTEGLLLWIDAARQPAAWQAHRKPTLAGTVPLDVAYDGSGNGWHLVQRVHDSQPRFTSAGGHAALRFDGKDDFLGRTLGKRALKEFTLFVHAAPRSNPGYFRALFAGNEAGKNDYTTGFNLDLGGASSAVLNVINVEGKGFQGARDLLPGSRPFGRFHTFAVICTPGPGGVRVELDGKPAGRRDRAPGSVRIDHLTLGARCLSNTADPPAIVGFLDGDVAEVLLFDRALSDEERVAVREYLAKKHAGLDEALASTRAGVPLVPVKDPPPVQVLVPGFTVKQLPLNLPNINNVRYRHDGKLVALGYNGNIYILSDTDRDGLEDRADVYWENKGHFKGPIGMAVTPRGYRHGDGVFVASKGKVSLVVDTDHDDKGDREIIVARGWKEGLQQVDAVGLALDKEGNVYFGVGTPYYANPYLLDDKGKTHFDIKEERGTILKVSPDFKKREVVCTGIRFTIGLGFNRRGDLFATDQEGATWLPNGNPFDELLHIRPGRHFGFPPRHPKHLPGVLDEPSTFDYGPQHESTCGLFFNDPVNGGPTFGPKAWAGDALVCGESRGKLFRTELVPTPAGYVARTHLVARLTMLTVDSCVSPAGALVITTHSGPPDWGTGPTGKGKLYKVFYTDRDHPQPAFAWAAGPNEVRIAFDRPLDIAQLHDLAKSATIEYGRYVRAGDRFETIRPPYAVVQQQMAEPRFRLPVLSAALTPDRRTLVLATAAHPGAAHYALTLPGMGRPRKPGAGELPQHPAIDLCYDLGGVKGTWQPKEGPAVSAWLPHADLDVARAFTTGSADHAPFWKSLRGPGRLTLATKLDLTHMLHPRVQPGSTLDYTPPPERVTLHLASSHPFTARLAGDAAVKSTGSTKSGYKLSLKVPASHEGPVPLEVVLMKGEGKSEFRVTFTTNEDDRERPLALRRFLLPWARPEAAPSGKVVRKPVPELKGGDWVRGRKVFFGEEAACARCHQVNGRGGVIGPDLSNLVHRDYASVLRDVVQPSAALNPDHIAYQVMLKNGRVLTGVPRPAGKGQLILGDAEGKEHTLDKKDIDETYVSSVSIMPEGIDKKLGPEKMRDLLTFLLTRPLEPAPIEAPGAPPPRPRAEVEAVLKGATRPEGPLRPLKVVLAGGPKDHGPGEHDYPLWQRRWYNLLSLADDLRVQTVSGWPPDKLWDEADVIVFYSANPGWTADRAKQLDAFLARGGGLVYLHWAINGHKDPDVLAKRTGLATGAGSRFRHGPLELSFTDRTHPITRGFEKVRFVDESYWNLKGDEKGIHVLATAPEEGKPRPLLWTRTQGKGRVFVNILGHYTWTFDDPLFRILVLRGVAWSAGEPADRLIDLATVGARVGE
jgi:putative heme-binding domain-containing protein